MCSWRRGPRWSSGGRYAAQGRAGQGRAGWAARGVQPAAAGRAAQRRAAACIGLLLVGFDPAPRPGPSPAASPSPPCLPASLPPACPQHGSDAAHVPAAGLHCQPGQEPGSGGRLLHPRPHLPHLCQAEQPGGCDGQGWVRGSPPEAQAARLGCGVGLAPPLARSQPCSRVHACCTPPFPRLPLPRPCCPRCPPVLPTHTAACPTALLHPRCCLPYRATPPCCSPVLPLALAPPVLPLPLPPPVLPLPPPVLPPRRERGQPG